MSFNVDSKCVHPRSWFRALMVRHRHDFVNRFYLFDENLCETKFYDVSWCQMSSLVTPDTLGSLHTCPGSFSRSLIVDDFWWISGVLRWGPLEESASHPLSSARWVPKVSYGQIVSKWRILDIDYNDVWRIFHPCRPQVLNRQSEWTISRRLFQNLEMFVKSELLESGFMKSREVKCHPWWFLILQEVSIRVLVFFLKILVISCAALEESASHPLSICKMECPKFYKCSKRAGSLSPCAGISLQWRTYP